MQYIYDNPSRSPQESWHWQSLSHHEGDRCLANIQQVTAQLLADVQRGEDFSVAVWSVLLGYCEALCTSSKERFNPFPIPWDALCRLVQNEFTLPPSAAEALDPRQAARQVSNFVWSKVVSKSNVKDEKHANSLYTVLRGRQHNKSVDCFGAALVSVLALRQQGYTTMSLQLSEDHAYARMGNETYEVAIPGHTKAQQEKRGQEIAQSFVKRELTPADSWLYMEGYAVTCDTNGKILAAALANVNCLIENKANYEMYSEPLLIIKRDLLWELKDQGHDYLDRLSFGLCELGWAEEHMTSARGQARIALKDDVETNSVMVTTMEHLYHQAVECSKMHYGDKQVYPYCYLGFFHKDGGQEEEEELGGRISNLVWQREWQKQ